MATAKPVKERFAKAGAVGGQNKKKKLSKKRLYWGIGAAVLLLVIWIGSMPLVGTVKYGICQVFIERTLTYPTEMKVTAVVERGDVVRMDYAYLNEYGEYMVGAAQCSFRTDPNTMYALDEVTINRNPVPAEELAVFNTAIPAILQTPPSLVLPPPVPVQLKDLQR